MKAARIHNFGPPNVVVVEDVSMPLPGPSEVLVRVMAAGVAPWTRSSVRARARSAPNLRSPSVRTSPASSRRWAPALQASPRPTKLWRHEPAILWRPGRVRRGQGRDDRAQTAIAESHRSSIGSRYCGDRMANALPICRGDARTNGNRHRRRRNVGAYAVQMAVDAGIKSLPSPTSMTKPYSVRWA